MCWQLMYKLLYYISMEMSRLFSSSSKYRILRTLSRRFTPIHMRALADLAEVQIRAAQLAVAGLLKDGVVVKSRQANRCMYTLDPRSQFVDHLRRYFKGEQERQTSMRAQQYRDWGGVLERVHELRMLSWTGR